MDPSKSASHCQLRLAPDYNDNDILDIGSDMHGLLEDKQDALLLGQYAVVTAG